MPRNPAPCAVPPRAVGGSATAPGGTARRGFRLSGGRARPAGHATGAAPMIRRLLAVSALLALAACDVPLVPLI
ncbi:hypothetical protein GE300_01485 [Rhodobacteraceae bacterium 2CG4]|uniref:Uncharacterized protein n=1 Tax=Halovulum marinum TaxID=2662447 RepID=A0A6L5YVL7_9RHOB|nr:hypothetical protein [Halovulum marinum]